MSVLVEWPTSRYWLNGVSHDGWLSRDTRDLLLSLPKEDVSCIVEVGSWTGKSARAMLDFYKNATITCIDTWDGGPEHHDKKYADVLPHIHELFVDNCWDYRSRINMVRGDSLDGMVFACRSMMVDPSLVYIDGGHETGVALTDIMVAERLWPKARIVVDDAEWASVNLALRLYEQATTRKIEKREKAWMIL